MYHNLSIAIMGIVELPTLGGNQRRTSTRSSSTIANLLAINFAQPRKSFMPYVSTNYANNLNAPIGKWVCAPTSRLPPFATAPSGTNTKGTDLCGQCVSYVKKTCPTLPVTSRWNKRAPVRDNAKIATGTVIATFNAAGKYEGHAAIYVSQSVASINVYDQYVTAPSPKAIGPRMLRWGAHGNSNDGNSFYVVE